MNKIKLNKFISRKSVAILALVSLLSVSGTTYAVVSGNKTDSNTPKTTQKVNKDEPVEDLAKDTPEVSSEPIIEAPAPVQTQPEPAAAPHIKTNDELIAEYGWQNLSRTIEYINQNMPDLFTDANRESTFKYMKDVGTAYMVKLNVTPGASTDTLYHFNILLSNPTMQRWIEIGDLTGVDTSRYK